MKKVILPNGLQIIYQQKKGKTLAVEVMVRVGSNHESSTERGISHMIEHLLFEGTSKRPSSKEIANEIERIGGEFNAYTSNNRTCYYVKVLNKNFPVAIDVLADILQNPLFREKDFLRERNVVFKEIDMVYDDPRYYQWVLFQKNLFSVHPCRFPAYGDKKVLQKLSVSDVKKYYEKWYQPNNIVISLVGDVKNWKKEIEYKFSFKKGKLPAKKKLKEEKGLTKNKIYKEKRKISNSHLVLGFKTVARSKKDSYVLDLIQAVLGRGQSGTIFNELRAIRGLAYDVGTEHVSEVDYGYFAIFASIDHKNKNLVKKLILEELEKLQNLSLTDLRDAKNYLEGDFYLGLEDKQKIADQLIFWQDNGSADLMNSYIKEIKKVGLADIRRVARKYFTKYCFVMIEGK